MSGACTVGLAALIAYALGEAPAIEDETPASEGEAVTEALDLDAFEDHLFACARCERRLESIDRLRRAVSDEVLHGALGGSVNAAFLDRARRDGVTLRQYRIAEGGTVACSAGPEDLMVVRLAAAGAGDAGELRVDAVFEDLERGASSPLPPRQVFVDRQLQEVVMVFPGEEVRAYPRSRWTLHLRGESEAGAIDLGPFVMDHTP